MKKTLVALAALVAVGSSFAQSTVNLTGTYAAGYESQSNLTTAASIAASPLCGAVVGVACKQAGFGTDTASMQLNAVEDLGGGLKVSALVSAGGMVRGGSVGGEDARVRIDGGFGAFYLTTFETAGSGVHAVASAGVPGYDLQGRVFGGNVNIDLIGYSSWDMSGFKFHVNYVDYGFSAPGAASVGINGGTDGSTFSQPSIGVAGTYTQGPINARVDYTSWTRQSEAAAGGNSKDRIRLSGTYDFGMAKVGLGYSQRNFVVGNATNETVMSLSAPIGAARVGFTYGKSENTQTNVVKSGYTLGGQYDISKRTNVGASLFSWKTDGIAGDNTGFRVLLAHSF
jgi:Gram-negative porin